METARVFEIGDTAIAEGNFVGTHTGPLATPNGAVPATGRRMDLPFSDFFEVKDGKVISHRVYFDQMALMAQLGLLPEPAAAP
jgi:predicted ester cyclase